MRHWNVKRRMIAGFSAVMLIMVALSLFAYEPVASSLAGGVSPLALHAA